MQVGHEPFESGYKEVVRQLLNVDGTPTGLGQYLLDKMKEHPDRFMLGTDVDDGYLLDYAEGAAGYVPGDNERYGVLTYEASWDTYEEFLSQPTTDGDFLDAYEKRMVRLENAIRVLYA